MYPPLPFISRICTKDFCLPEKNLHIKKGMKVMISVHGIHQDPKIYPNPEKFDPSRFTPEQIAQRHPADFLGYGLGPRDCNGEYKFEFLNQT